MPLAYEITETEDTRIINFRFYALGLWSLIIGFCLSEFIKVDGLGKYMAAPFWIIGMFIVLPSWKVSRECRDVMRNEGVKISGSKWSLTNPLRVEIQKNDTANQGIDPMLKTPVDMPNA